MLIGDIIMSARELMTDLPSGLLGSPNVNSPGPAPAVVAMPGSFLGPGTYWIKVTLTTAYGETFPSVEFGPFVIAANQGIQVTTIGWANVPSSVRVYFTSTGPAGSENLYVTTPIPLNSIVTLIVGDPTFSASVVTGYPPARNTAFLPDSDGRFVNAWTLYRWLNDALTTASLVCGGIPDVSGIQMVSGQGFYTMPGIWDKLENCWYDGFPVAFDARSGAFYRNVLSGITFIGILQTSSDRQIMELQPQPSRAGGVTTLSAGIGISDTTIPLTAISQFGLPLGMARIGTEVISYGSISGNALKGCSRGLGGTQQSAWPSGTAITELNFRFGGLRLAQQARYKPGDSNITLQVPPGWSQPLTYYLASRFADAEQDDDGGEKALKRFVAFLKEYQKGTKQTGGPRQVGMVTSAGDGYPSASSGGRIIIP